MALAALGYGVLGGLPLGVRAPFEAAAVLGVAACATLSLVATAQGWRLPALTVPHVARRGRRPAWRHGFEGR